MKVACFNPILLSAATLIFFGAGCAIRQPAVAVYSPPAYTQYDYPLVSPGAKFTSLPVAVQHTIRAQTGAAQIDDIIKDTKA